MFTRQGHKKAATKRSFAAVRQTFTIPCCHLQLHAPVSISLQAWTAFSHSQTVEFGEGVGVGTFVVAATVTRGCLSATERTGTHHQQELS